MYFFAACSTCRPTNLVFPSGFTRGSTRRPSAWRFRQREIPAAIRRSITTLRRSPTCSAWDLPLKEARNWGICGCIEPVVLGITDFQTNSSNFNVNKILEITLHNGYDPLTKKQLGIKTGDPRKFTCIGDVMEAFEAQLDFFMEKMIKLANATLGGHAFTLPTITASCFSRGCIERARCSNRRVQTITTPPSPSQAWQI